MEEHGHIRAAKSGYHWLSLYELVLFHTPSAEVTSYKTPKCRTAYVAAYGVELLSAAMAVSGVVRFLNKVLVGVGGVLNVDRNLEHYQY